MINPLAETYTSGRTILRDVAVGHIGKITKYNDELYFVTWYDDYDSPSPDKLPEGSVLSSCSMSQLYRHEDILPNVIKISEGFYNRNNNKHGRHIYYYSNGEKKIEICFKDGIKHGPEIGYLNNGKVHYYINYDNGIYHGQSLITSLNNYNRVEKLNYNYGKYDGIQEIYMCGVLIQSFEYVNGKKHGMETQYDMNGKLMSRWTWKDNKKNGNYNQFHPNGQLHIIGEFINDVLHGPLIERDPYGKQISKRIYLNGIEVGVFTS